MGDLTLPLRGVLSANTLGLRQAPGFGSAWGWQCSAGRAVSVRHRPSTSSPRPDVCRTRKGQTAPRWDCPHWTPPRWGTRPRIALERRGAAPPGLLRESEATAMDRQPDPCPAQPKRSRFEGVLLPDLLSLSSNAFAPSKGEVCPANPRTLVQKPSQTARQMTHRLPREKRAKVPKSARKAYAKAAAKCASGGIRDALTSTWTAHDQAVHRNRKLGSFGAASPVIRINPETMEPFE